eukprot:gene6978-7528_t
MDYKQQRGVVYSAVNPIDLDVPLSQPILPTVNAPSAPYYPATVVGLPTSHTQPMAVFEVLPPLPPNYSATQQEDQRQWKIDLCEVGDCSSCLYSYLCPACAVADARTELDGSNWYVNCVVMKPVAARWLVRTAYNIPGNAQNDCWTGLFLPCCTANQLLQTTKHYGKTNLPEVGPTFNVNPRLGIQQRSFENLFYDVCYSCFCRPCAVGYSLQAAGMPFWFGACCVGVFEANSILRYQNRNRPIWDNECYPDLIIPLLCMSVSNETAFASMITYATGLLAESNTKAGRTYGYGCDIGGALAYGYSYCATGCVCSEPEGRYLVR